VDVNSEGLIDYSTVKYEQTLIESKKKLTYHTADLAMNSANILNQDESEDVQKQEANDESHALSKILS